MDISIGIWKLFQGDPKSDSEACQGMKNAQK
jgi:hypothetical protein